MNDIQRWLPELFWGYDISLPRAVPPKKKKRPSVNVVPLLFCLIYSYCSEVGGYLFGLASRFLIRSSSAFVLASSALREAISASFEALTMVLSRTGGAMALA